MPILRSWRRRQRIAGQGASFIVEKTCPGRWVSGRKRSRRWRTSARVLLGPGFGGVAQQEADGDDDVAAFIDESIDVLLVVGLLLALQVLPSMAELGMASWTPFQAWR